MDDRIVIEVVHGGHEAVLELLLGRDTDVAQNRTGDLGEEALDEVEPRAMRGSEGELEAAGARRATPWSPWRYVRNDCRGSGGSPCGPDRLHRGA